MNRRSHKSPTSCDLTPHFPGQSRPHSQQNDSSQTTPLMHVNDKKRNQVSCLTNAFSSLASSISRFNSPNRGHEFPLAATFEDGLIMRWMSLPGTRIRNSNQKAGRNIPTPPLHWIVPEASGVTSDAIRGGMWMGFGTHGRSRSIEESNDMRRVIGSRTDFDSAAKWHEGSNWEREDVDVESGWKVGAG